MRAGSYPDPAHEVVFSCDVCSIIVRTDESAMNFEGVSVPFFDIFVIFRNFLRVGRGLAECGLPISGDRRSRIGPVL